MLVLPQAIKEPLEVDEVILKLSRLSNNVVHVDLNFLMHEVVE